MCWMYINQTSPKKNNMHQSTCFWEKCQLFYCLKVHEVKKRIKQVSTPNAKGWTAIKQSDPVGRQALDCTVSNGKAFRFRQAANLCLRLEEERYSQMDDIYTERGSTQENYRKILINKLNTSWREALLPRTDRRNNFTKTWLVRSVEMQEGWLGSHRWQLGF